MLWLGGWQPNGRGTGRWNEKSPMTLKMERAHLEKQREQAQSSSQQRRHPSGRGTDWPKASSAVLRVCAAHPARYGWQGGGASIYGGANAIVTNGRVV